MDDGMRNGFTNAEIKRMRAQEEKRWKQIEPRWNKKWAREHPKEVHQMLMAEWYARVLTAQMLEALKTVKFHD
jgi:hypothetical protein